MDQSQFQTFLDKLTEISKSLEEMLDKQDEIKEASGGKEKRPGLFGRDKSPSKLSSKEKKIEAEKGTIYAKEFAKMFEDMEDDRKKNENKVNEMFKKNLIKVSLEWVGRRAIDQLKNVLSESTVKNVKDKKTAAAAGGGGFLGGLAGGLGGGLTGVLGAFNALIPMIMAIGGIAVLITLVKNLDKVGDFIKSVLPSLGDFLIKILPVAADNILKLLNGAMPLIKDLLGFLKDLFFKVLESLPSILKSVSDAIMPIINKIFDFLSGIDFPALFKTIFDGIKGILEIIAAQIPVLIPPVLKLGEAVKEIILTVIGYIPDILRGVKGVVKSLTGFAKVALPIISDFLKSIFDFVLQIAPYLKDIALKYLDTIKTIIIAVIPYVKDIVAVVMDGVKFLAPILENIILKALDRIQVIVLDLFDTIRDVAPYFTKQVGYVKDAIVALSKPLDTLIDKLGDVLIKILDTVKEGIISTRENLKTLAGMVRGINIVDYFKLATGISALGVAMATFGLADGTGKLFQAAGSFFSLGKQKSAVDIIVELAKNEKEIFSVASSLDLLGKVVGNFTTVSSGDKFFDEMKKVSAGIALLTNVDKIENLDKLKNLGELKDLFVQPTSTTAEVKLNEVDKAETSQLFGGIYTVTAKVNDKMDSINGVLVDLNKKFSEMLVLQNKQTNLAAESIDHLDDINTNTVESSKGNVTVANSNSNIIFNEKSTSQFDFRREMALRFASSVIT